MEYDAVIFDLFGTLVDTFPFREHELMLSEMAAALSASPHDFSRLWVETFNERGTGAFPTLEANIEYICRVLALPLESARVTAVARIRVDFTRRILTPRPDAVETLAQLRVSGYKIGLISDCSPEVPLLWKDTPFSRLVDAPIFSCAVGLRKPDPRMYQLACERLAVMSQNCLYVGDGSSRELTGASQFGMHSVLIRVPYQDTYDVHRPDAEEWQGPTVSALKDVMTLLE